MARNFSSSKNWITSGGNPDDLGFLVAGSGTSGPSSYTGDGFLLWHGHYQDVVLEGHVCSAAEDTAPGEETEESYYKRHPPKNLKPPPDWPCKNSSFNNGNEELPPNFPYADAIYGAVQRLHSEGIDISPRLLAALMAQESMLGRNLTDGYGDGGKAVGLFQFDIKNSGLDDATLERARTDPEYAAYIAGKIMSKNLKLAPDSWNGIRYYNAGPASGSPGTLQKDPDKVWRTYPNSVCYYLSNLDNWQSWK